MGGPGGVRGQPSTWLTQLVERLLRHTEDPGWLAGWHPRWATHTHTHTDNTHSTDRNAHTPILRLSLWLSVTHTLQALSRLVASVLSGHRPPRWIQSATLSVSGTHTSVRTHRSPLLSALAEGEHVVLPVWFPLPSRLPSPFPRPCQLCPLSLSAAIWLPPPLPPHPAPPPPLCHPLDSFPYASFPCWSFTDSSKCTTQPSGSLDLLYVQSVTPRNTPHSFSQIRDFRFHTIVAKHRLLNQYLCDCCKQKDSSLILPNTTEQHVAKKKNRTMLRWSSTFSSWQILQMR